MTTASTAPDITSVEPLMKFKSHIEGKNADVEILTDRIDWSRAGRRRGTEMMPVKAISSVMTKKEGFSSKVVVVASGNTLEFKVDRATAEKAKELLTQLVTGTHPSQQVLSVPTPTASSNVADELVKLASLRDSGVLTDAEFEIQKARLLG